MMSVMCCNFVKRNQRIRAVLYQYMMHFHKKKSNMGSRLTCGNFEAYVFWSSLDSRIDFWR